MTDNWIQDADKISRLAANPATGNLISRVLKKEPLVASSLVAALGVFSTVRWGASKVDLTSQLISGLLPILLAFIARQWVTPVSKLDNPATVASVQSGLSELQSVVDELVSGKTKTAIDQIAAALAGGLAGTVTVTSQTTGRVAPLPTLLAAEPVTQVTAPPAPPLAALNLPSDTTVTP